MIIIWTNNSTLTLLFLASFLWRNEAELVPMLRSRFNDLLELRWPLNDIFLLLSIHPARKIFLSVVFLHVNVFSLFFKIGLVSQFSYLVITFIYLHSSPILILLTFDFFFSWVRLGCRSLSFILVRGGYWGTLK